MEQSADDSVLPARIDFTKSIGSFAAGVACYWAALYTRRSRTAQPAGGSVRPAAAEQRTVIVFNNRGEVVADLLVLGSKPEPCLPPSGAYGALACANASGRSARALGLPDPIFTVISSVLGSRKNPSSGAALKALAGLSTKTLYYCPRQMYRHKPLKRLLNLREMHGCAPGPFTRRLRASGYRFEAVVVRPLGSYIRLVETLCGDDPQIARELEAKHPSTGVLAAAIGLAEAGFERVILSGFSFEITHAYAENPAIARRGTASSRHADADIAVLRRISSRTGRLLTTEPVVHERTGIPLIEG